MARSRSRAISPSASMASARRNPRPHGPQFGPAARQRDPPALERRHAPPPVPGLAVLDHHVAQPRGVTSQVGTRRTPRTRATRPVTCAYAGRPELGRLLRERRVPPSAVHRLRPWLAHSAGAPPPPADLSPPLLLVNQPHSPPPWGTRRRRRQPTG